MLKRRTLRQAEVDIAYEYLSQKQLTKFHVSNLNDYRIRKLSSVRYITVIKWIFNKIATLKAFRLFLYTASFIWAHVSNTADKCLI